MTPRSTRSQASDPPSLKVQSAWMLLGRLSGFSVAFIVPIVIVRLLDQDDYGTYKQFLLVAGFLISVLPLGAGASLYYFIPRRPDRAAVYLLRTFSFVLSGGTLAALLLWVLRGELAGWLESPDLARLSVLLGVFIVLEMLGQLLESLMVIERRAGQAAVFIFASDVSRAIALLTFAVLTRDVFWVCVGATLYASIRAATFSVWSLRTFRDRSTPKEPDDLRDQVSFALPIGLSVLLHNVVLRFHSFYVAASTSPALFAVYAVGTQQIAPVQVVFRSLFDVTLVRMTEHFAAQRWGALQALWRTLIAKQALLMIPVVVGMWTLAPAFIEAVFTSAYLDAVPVFRLNLLMIWLTMINDHSVLRACGQTEVIFAASVTGLLSTVAAVPVLTGRLGLVGAVGGFLLGMLGAKLVGLWRLRSVLRMTTIEVLPLRSLGRYALGSCAAAALVYPIMDGGGRALTRFLLGGSAFWMIYGALGWWAGVFTDDDRRDVRRAARRVLSGFREKLG